MRALWLALGLASLGVGLVGIVTPLLPTTPFLLLAALALSKSAPRLASWLLDHPRLGPPIRDWQHQGTIGRGTKTVALATMMAAPVVSLALAVPVWAIAVQGAVLAGAAAFVVSRPEPPAPVRRGP